VAYTLYTFVTSREKRYKHDKNNYTQHTVLMKCITAMLQFELLGNKDQCAEWLSQSASE